LAVLTAIAVAASAYIYNWARNYVANQLVNMPEFVAPPAQPHMTIISGTPSINLLPTAWNGKERVNLLLTGIDQREGEQEPAYRTDTMMVLTLDPVTLDAGILSIPRDLWVPIPGFENGRINTANFIGDAYDYPGGGTALAVKTVEQVLGIPIHFYARVNFTAFEDLVDRIGGIVVDVPYDIYDPEYPTSNYGTEVFTLTKGAQTLDGATALKFARTRHSLPNGDFDRAVNQQAVMKAIKERLKDPQVLLSLFASAPEIVANLSASVQTNLSLDQMQQLAVLALQVDTGGLKSAVLDQNYTELATTQTNPPQQVQVPIRSRIAELREEFFAVKPDAAAETAGLAAGEAQSWQAEQARIAVLNGTMTAGFAQRASEALIARGFQVVSTGNPPDERFDRERTEITDFTGKTLTTRALADALNVSGTAEVRRVVDPLAGQDIVVILGADVKLP
jgi:LCP family protein required for cell wall assembly